MKKKETKKYDAKTVVNFVKDILYESDWENGYSFIGGKNLYLENINIKNFPSKKRIHLLFTIEFRTNSRKVINNVTWKYTYNNIISLQKNINTLEAEIMQKTGSKDDVFSDIFNSKLFVEKGYEKLGWKIIK